MLSSIAMISFYILSKRFFLKHEGLSHARVKLIAKQEYDFAHIFYKCYIFYFHQFFSVQQSNKVV